MSKKVLYIKTVFDGVMTYLEDQGHSPATIKDYKTALYKLDKFCGSRGGCPYSVETGKDFLAFKESEHTSGKIKYRTWCAVRRTIAMSDEFFLTGSITVGNHCVTSHNTVPISEQHGQCLDSYESYLKTKNLCPRTIYDRMDAAKNFLHYAEGNGIYHPMALTNQIVSEFIPIMGKARKASLGEAAGNVRRFLQYLAGLGLVDEMVPEALSVHYSRPRKLHYGFTREEADSILSAVDRSTPMGKRDFAVLTLARETGLRAVDIRKLRLRDIRWEEAEIRIVQSKTQEPLTLPLMKNVGDAIADYILHARPESKSEHVFLTARRPYSPMGYLGDIVQKYARLSGVAGTTKAGLGPHSFRRGLGVELVEAGTPLSVTAEILGHSRQESTKKYIALDIANLIHCAMPMAPFIPEGGAADE